MKKILLSLLALSAPAIATAKNSNDGTSPVFQAKVDKLGSHKYQCYCEPVAVRTKSGRLVVGVQAGNRMAWPERSGQDLVVRYSDNNGKSWSPLIIAAEHGNYSCQSHGLVYDAEKNRLNFLYVTYNWDYSAIKGRGTKATAPLYLKMHEEGKTPLNAYMVTSDDEGKTWSQPRDITANVGGDAHFGASEGRQLTLGKYKGRLLLAGGDERNIDKSGKVINKQVGVWRSDDHGKTWTFAQIKVNEVVSCEARVTELADGTLLYNARLKKAGKGRLLATSKDGGETWSNIHIDKSIKTSKSNACTLTLTDAKGKLTNTVLCSTPRGGLKHGSIYVSKDGGKTWPIHKLIIPNGYFKYSAITQIDANTIGFFYETNHYKDIRYKTLKVSDLIK